MSVKRCLVVAVALFLDPFDASAIPAPHFGEQLAGSISPAPADPSTRWALTLNLDCYGPDEEGASTFCGGTYRCRRAALARLPTTPSPCLERSAKINFEMRAADVAMCQEATVSESGLSTISFDTRFHNGVVCHFTGFTQELLFSFRIPLLRGRYDCRRGDGSLV